MMTKLKMMNARLSTPTAPAAIVPNRSTLGKTRRRPTVCLDEQHDVPNCWTVDRLARRLGCSLSHVGKVLREMDLGQDAKVTFADQDGGTTYLLMPDTLRQVVGYMTSPGRRSIWRLRTAAFILSQELDAETGR